MDAEEKLFFAKVLALKEQPYLRSIISSLNPIAINSFPELTISVDMNWNLSYNPDFIDTLGANECSALILHEAYHIIYNHSERFLGYKLPDKSHSLWNEAGDAAINSELIESGINFGTLSPIVAGEYSKYPEWRKGQTTEEMFFSTYNTTGGHGQENNAAAKGAAEATKEDAPDGDQSSEEAGKGSNSKNKEETNQNTETSTTDVADPSEDNINSPNDQNAQQPEPPNDGSQPGAGNCGSVADGEKREWEGITEGQQSLEDHDKTMTINKLTKDVLAAESHTPGTVPGGLFTEISSMSNSSLNWRRILEHKVRAKVATVSGARNYTYSRPSRRSVGMYNSDKKFFTPAIRGYKNPSVAFVLDTSGSMGVKELSQALGEIDKVVKDLRIRSVDVIQCDTAAHVYRNVTSIRDIIPHGRGGTNMSEGIKAIAKNIKPVPDIIIIVTDGYTPWPKVPYPILRNTAHIACLIIPKRRPNPDISNITKSIPKYIDVIPVIF